MKKSKIVTIGLVAISINLSYGNNKNILNSVMGANENTDLQTNNIYPQNPKNTADTTGKSSVTNKQHTSRGVFDGFFRRSGTKSITRGGFGKATANGHS